MSLKQYHARRDWESNKEQRIQEAVGVAEWAFWAAIANNFPEITDEAKLMYLEYNDSIAIDKIIYAGQNDQLKVVVNGRAKSFNKQPINNNIIYVNFRRYYEESINTINLNWMWK